MNLEDLKQVVRDVDIFQDIPSTNQKLWELIDQKYSLPRVAIALQQSAGRGQWGRVWESPPGGLYLSLGLPLDLEVNCGPHLTIAVAWGIAQRLRTLDLPILLKWPNDLILQGRKLGGIKIETRVCQGIITYGVVGVGINYTNPVPPTGINLEEIASQFTLTDLAKLTLTGIFSGYDYYLQQGIKPVLDAYHQLLSNLGQEIILNQSPGVIIGVNDKGELGIRLFSSGASVAIFLQPGTIKLGYSCKEILKISECDL
ncbi:MAG: biotin--[acetyl-CoA-carboxylase] ligase [Gloeocapsa sp. DLM2.Bin57]|nr:MAG: biotin--[acetyl-CoA-carboxylase] ligase [Gloeocapsa sp. DLM2.Bin57]